MTSEYESDLDEVLKKLKEMLVKKHHDYGVNNLIRHGLFGINVRLNDKLARLDNLILFNKEPEVEDETIDDTYRDVAGYAIQAILMSQNKI